MIEFKRNEKTGIVEVWKDGEKTGEIRTQGDDVKEEAGALTPEESKKFWGR